MMLDCKDGANKSWKQTSTFLHTLYSKNSKLLFGDNNCSDIFSFHFLWGLKTDSCLQDTLPRH